MKFTDGSTAYSVSGKDSVLDISQVWKQSEFNVVGDAGGSRADFNEPVSITVKVALTDGSSSAPTCVADDGHGREQQLEPRQLQHRERIVALHSVRRI